MDAFDITSTGENDKPKTMSSIEIAELTGKRHDHVIRDVRKMLEDLGDTSPQFWGKVPSEGGRPLVVANLPRRECLILVSGYDVQLRARVIDRWERLERERMEPKADTSMRLPNSAREARLFMKHAMGLAKIGGLLGNQMLIAANRATRKAVGFDYLDAMGMNFLAAPDNDVLITATEIGRRLGAISAVRVNHLLAEHGYQTGEKDGKGRAYWLPTERGIAAGGQMVDVERSNKSGQARQLRWPSGIVDALRQIIQAA